MCHRFCHTSKTNVLLSQIVLTVRPMVVSVITTFIGSPFVCVWLALLPPLPYSWSGPQVPRAHYDGGADTDYGFQIPKIFGIINIPHFSLEKQSTHSFTLIIISCEISESKSQNPLLPTLFLQSTEYHSKPRAYLPTPNEA